MKKSKKIAMLGVFLALALVCSYVETLIPINFGVPGMKLGLTNIVIILILYCMGPVEAIIISILRIFLVGFMFGNAFSIIYSLGGGLLSFVIMYLMKRFSKLNIISISITGGMSHNMGQLLVAMFVMSNTYLVYYLPVLLIAGLITGCLIGLVAQSIYPRINKIFQSE